MTNRPILFSGPMVRAILDGRKTQTRRVLKPQDGAWEDATREIDCEGRDVFIMCGAKEASGLRPVLSGVVPKYQIGDRLWVREQCATWGKGPEPEPVEYPVAYAADDPEWEGIKRDARASDGDEWNIRPSIHMPRWASRLTLTVTDVRVQRVQEISAPDMRSEGLDFPPGPPTAPWHVPKLREDYWRPLWDSLNAPRGYGWDANPWVVAYTFTVQRGNIDQVEARHG